jgi:2-C-methyl-D-erythritol 4-phosphate cytidylyltransferase
MPENATSGETVWTVVVAAGSGLRFGSAKQFARLGDRRVVDWAVDEARRHSVGVVTVVPKGSATGQDEVEGGATRSESVRRGIAAVPDDATIILVHDAARPFAGAEIFRRVIGAVVDGADAAVPGIPVTDTIKQVNESDVVVSTPRRETLRAVQTPQAFRASALRRAHASGAEGTDDAMLVEHMGLEVRVVDGDHVNRKITGTDDLEWAQAHAAALVSSET